MSGTQTAFKLAFQITPILLVGGIAAGVPGNTLPIITLTEGASVIAGILTGSFPATLDDYFAQFTVIPAGDLIAQEIGHYPFANQQVAANAVITEPLSVQVRMDCPAKQGGDYVSKFGVLTALQAALSAHNSSGGLYTVLTPAFAYVNCLMKSLKDISGAGSTQVQYQWLFDFEQPLVTVQAAQQAYSNLLNSIASGGQQSSTPSWSSISTAAQGAGSTIVNGLGNVGSIAGGLLGNIL